MPRPASISHPRIRWRIFAMLVSFAVVVYFQQRSLTAAAERIMPALSLSQTQIFLLQWAFVLSYAAFQFPGGVFGQRLGARRTLTLTMLIAVLATAIVPLAPSLLTGTGLFIVLFASQFLLGVAHAPFMPVCAGVMEAWLPARRFALAQGLHTSALQIGAALAPPVVGLLMLAFGWQGGLFWAALPQLALIGLWYWYGRNAPAEHAAVSSEEIGELSPESSAPPDSAISRERILRILRNQDVRVLTLSYIVMNYVFYLLANSCLLYLVHERHFEALEGAWLAALPPIGAAIGSATGGAATDTLCRRFGLRWGFRIMPLIALPIAGVLLLAAVYSASAYAAVAALSAAYAAVEINEGPYWAATMRIARADTMAATGVMNTGGNIGGIIGIPVAAYLVTNFGWTSAFVLGVGCAVIAALLWLFVDASRPMRTEANAAPGVGA